MDLSSTYMGLRLRNPIVASASPLSRTISGIQRLVDAGVGAIVLYSLFEEELRHRAAQNAALTEAGAESFAESLSYFAALAGEDPGPKRHLELLERCASFGVPLIASLNGSTAGGWISYARDLQSAGAAAIELNIFYLPGGSGREVEQRHVDIVESVKSVVSIPVAVKLSPHFSSVMEMALRLEAAGADGLVLFNRYPYPDIDLNTLSVVRHVSLSTAADAGLPRLWIALLFGKIRASLAATTGVETSDDVVKFILAGADVVMTTSALWRNGPEFATVLIDGLAAWLRARQLSDLEEVRGLMTAPGNIDRSDHERARYVDTFWAADMNPWVGS
jgi:dihydroorotate dehydrogenase (fumarate)